MRRLPLVAAGALISGLLTAFPAVADTGVVSGVVTAEATGEPVGGACVTLFDLDLTEVVSGCADADGHYEIPDVAAGSYKARATADGYPEMWAHHKGSGLAADVLDLPHALHFALRQGSGTVRGQITDQGAPAAGASVSITDVNQRWWSTVRTAADGTYAFTGLAPDAYRLQVTFGDRSQWVPQKSSVFDADTFTVTDDEVTVVDEAVVPYASLRVIATDEITGAPVWHACARLFGTRPPDRDTCAGSDGAMLFEDLPPFEFFTLSVWAADGLHWAPDEYPRIALSPGEVTEVRVTMRPAAAIVTRVRDSRTQDPLKDICVETHAVPVVGVIDRDYLDHCSDSTGTLVIGPIEPGAYRLLVKPLDERYGMQWVGYRGGTGDLRSARTVTTQVGRAVPIRPISMDPAGTITGVVTDRATGAPVDLVCAYPYAVDPRIGFGFGDNCSRDGTYTISGLGPYQWPVEFADSQGRYAWQWSGAAPDRFAAQPVRVQAHTSVIADAALIPGGLVTGRTFDRQSAPSFGYVYAYNARTGDIVDSTTSNFNGEYTVNSLATQDVKIQYHVDAGCWHRDAADFASATPIPVTAGHATGGIDLGPCTLTRNGSGGS